MTTTTLTAADFTFTLTEGYVQERNPGYGVWMTKDGQNAIIQSGSADGKHTGYTPCRRNRKGNLQGIDGYTAQKTFEAALERFEYESDEVHDRIPAGYMQTSTGGLVLAEDWDEAEN